MSEAQKLTVSVTADGVYVFKLKGGYYWIVNDIPLDLESKPGYVEEIITSKEKPVVRQLQHRNILSKYIDKDGNEIAIEEYERLSKKLLSKKIKTDNFDDDGDPCFEWQSLEDEFDYKRFFIKWTAVYNNVCVDCGPIECLYQKEIPNDNKYIIPLRCLGGDVLSTHSQYNEKEHVISLVKETLLSNHFVLEDGPRDKSVNNLQLYKLYTNGNKISLFIGCSPIDKHIEWHVDEQYTDSHDIIKEKYQKNIELIKNTLGLYISQRKIILNQITASEIITSLERIHKDIRELSVNKRSSTDKSVLLAFVRDVKGKLEMLGKQNE